MPNDLSFIYDDLREAKEAGTLPKWESITESQLLELYSSQTVLDVMVAELFDVSINQVRYLKKKYNVNTKRILAHRLNQANAASLEGLMASESMGDLAIALARYIYRDGPIEDYHADGKLSNDEMMVLNKFTANKIAGILYLAQTGQWFAMEQLLRYYRGNAEGWDAPEVDFDELMTIVGYDARK